MLAEIGETTFEVVEFAFNDSDDGSLDWCAAITLPPRTLAASLTAAAQVCSWHTLPSDAGVMSRFEGTIHGDDGGRIDVNVPLDDSLQDSLETLCRNSGVRTCRPASLFVGVGTCLRGGWPCFERQYRMDNCMVSMNDLVAGHLMMVQPG